MTAIRPIIACALFALCVGCSVDRSNWQGRWLGNRNLPVKPGDNELAIRTIGRVDLTIHANGRFDLFEGGVPKGGKIRYDGEDKAYLTVETFFDRPISEQGDAAVAMNKEIQVRKVPGGLAFRDPGGFDSGEIVLKKQDPSK